MLNLNKFAKIQYIITDNFSRGYPSRASLRPYVIFIVSKYQYFEIM